MPGHEGEKLGVSLVAIADSHSIPPLMLQGAPCGRIFGRDTQERLTRQFARAGSRADQVEKGPAILARADAVIDEPLIALLLKSPGLAILSDGNDPVVLAIHVPEGMAINRLFPILADKAVITRDMGLTPRQPKDLNAGFWEKLRKRETPYARLATPGNVHENEWRVFMGTYKGATDIITKRLWPVPAYHVTRAIAPLGITPNMVTTIGAIATIAAFWLFLRGEFALGLVAAWLMTFLDTVDGKLARTTLTSSKWGDVFDHGIDLVHPPFWYYAWGAGLLAAGYEWSPVWFWSVFAAILGGYVAQRVMEGVSIKWLGMEIHIWRKIDTYFREITARRNPNLVILTASLLAGRPDLGLELVAGWTLLCLALHGLQFAQAFRARPLSSWMSARP